MKILHPGSLIETVDAFNEAVFFREDWWREREALVDWLGTRLGKPHGYADSFAMTDSDWERDFRLFTGERVTTRAARSHILAEEATRLLRLVQAATGSEPEALRISEERLFARVFLWEKSSVRITGHYCCGKCSVALWRALAVGLYAQAPATLAEGISTLKTARDGKGGWRGYPYYYTLLALSEAAPELARVEFEYGAARLLLLKRLLAGKNDRFARRRLRLVDSALASLEKSAT